MRRQDEIEERESGIPSWMRAELAMRKFYGMPKRIVEITMDEMYPDVTKDFAKDVVETMIDIAETTEDKALSLNSQRIEWLKRWADNKPKKAYRNIAGSPEPPTVLTMTKVKDWLDKAKNIGLLDEVYMPTDSARKYELAYFVKELDNKYHISNRWKVFEQYWGFNLQHTKPSGSSAMLGELKKIFHPKGVY